MNNFNFRLKKLLDIRNDKEEESKREFKKAMDEKVKVEDKLSDLKDVYHEERQNKSTGTIVDRKIREKYLQMLDLKIEETCEELVMKEGILTDKRNDLILKQREKKTVEILKDKQYEEFVKEQNAVEQRNNDEFALYGFIRNLERR
ncbi:MAG: flagellar export protein FliJ [Clostridiaceae bacterium]